MPSNWRWRKSPKLTFTTLIRAFCLQLYSFWLILLAECSSSFFTCLFITYRRVKGLKWSIASLRSLSAQQSRGALFILLQPSSLRIRSLPLEKHLLLLLWWLCFAPRESLRVFWIFIRIEENIIVSLQSHLDGHFGGVLLLMPDCYSKNALFSIAYSFRREISKILPERIRNSSIFTNKFSLITIWMAAWRSKRHP